MFALKIQEWWVNILLQTTGGSWGSDCHSPGDSGFVCFWVWVIFLGFVSGSVFVLVLLSCSWWLSSTSLSSVFLFVVSLVCFIPPVTVSSSRVLSASTYLSCFLFHFDSPCPVCFCFPFVSLCQICPSCVPICSPSSVCCYVLHFCCAFLISFMFSNYIM